MRGIEVATCLMYLFLMSSNNHAYTDPVEDSLMAKLFTNYTVSRRPVGPDGEGITVHLSLVLMSMETLIIRTEQMETQIYLHVTWRDLRLSWDPDEFNGTTMLVIPPTQKIWLPRFALLNSEASDIYTESHFRLTGCRVNSEGKVIWEPGGIIRTSCDVNIIYYPFDTQNCAIRFGNWIYPEHQVNMTFDPGRVKHMLNMYDANGEWDIIGVDVTRASFHDPVTDVYYPTVSFELTFKRKWLFYIVNLILPALLLLFLQLFSFYLPPDSTDKISFGLTILLSFVVFVIVISENIPTTSHVSIIEAFFLTCLTSIIVQVILSIYVLHLQSMVTTYPPAWLRRLAGKIKKVEKPKSENSSVAGEPAYENSGFENKEMTPTVTHASGASSEEQETSIVAEDEAVERRHRELVGLLRGIHGLMQLTQRNVDDEARKEDIRQAWREVIIATDFVCFRFFAVFLLVLFLLLLVVTLLPSPPPLKE